MTNHDIHEPVALGCLRRLSNAQSIPTPCIQTQIDPGICISVNDSFTSPVSANASFSDCSESENEPPSHVGAEYTETFFGFVKSMTDAYMLVESVIAGGLRPCMEQEGNVRSGSVLVIPLTQNAKTKFKDQMQWSQSKPHGCFKLFREVEPKYSAIPKTARKKTKTEIFPACPTNTGTQTKMDGLCKHTLSMHGSNGQLYRVISYFRICDIEHFYTGARVPSVFHCPSQLPTYIRFIQDWMYHIKIQRKREEMEKDLLPLPPAVIPLDETEKPADNWELTATPCVRGYDEVVLNEEELELDLDSLMPLSLPPSILPVNESKETAIEQIRICLVQKRQHGAK